MKIMWLLLLTITMILSVKAQTQSPLLRWLDTQYELIRRGFTRGLLLTGSASRRGIATIGTASSGSSNNQSVNAAPQQGNSLRATSKYFNVSIIYCLSTHLCGPSSSGGIATDYGLDGPGSNPGGDEIFRPSRPAPGAHSASCKMGTRSFPGVKCGRGVLLTTHPLLVPRSWKSRAIPLPTLWAT